MSTKKKRGLGKGLDALLGLPPDQLAGDEKSPDDLTLLPVDLLQRSPYQPRIEFDKAALDDLAASIKAQGVVQPIVVRKLETGKYEIIAGERRWRAAQLVELYDVPVVIKDVTDLEAMCLALIENIQRQDLNPLEEARGISRLLTEFEMTHDDIAGALGKSRSTITNLLRLLDLSDMVKKMLESRQLEMGHARALLSLDAEQQLEIARNVVKKGLSVRQTESLVRNLTTKTPNKKSESQALDPDIRSLQDDLSGKLGASVTIKHKKSGNGTLEIHYSSVDELDGILSRIK
jgi:ParB family chromosome partitioning protein